MVHAWDITKNVPSAVSVEVWDKVGIYQIVSLVWSAERLENCMSQVVSLWRFGLGYNKKYDRGIVRIMIGKYQNVGPPYRLIIEKRYKNVTNRTEKGYFVENNADNRL